MDQTYQAFENVRAGSNLGRALVVLTICLVILQLFQNLGALPTRLWDESRLGINTIEMLNSGDYLVTRIGGEPDHWNTKPPLVIWMQVLFSLVFGYSEWSLRLPSAIAGFFTALAIGWYCLAKTRSVLLACLAALFLVSFSTYVGLHGTRTADYDAVLVLWTTLMSLCFLEYLDTGKNARLYLFSIFLVLAIMTKGIAALMLLPGLALLTVLKGKLRIVINPHLYLNILLVIFPVAVFYLIREQAAGGYLAAVSENELGGRFMQTVEEHREPFFYYFKRIYREENVPALAAIVGVLSGFGSGRKAVRSLCLAAVVIAMTFLMVISVSQTKLEWYHLPAVPFIAILAALGVYLPVRWVSARLSSGHQIAKLAMLVILPLCVVAFPFVKVLHTNWTYPDRPEEREEYPVGYLLKDWRSGNTDLEGYVASFGRYSPHIWVDINIARAQDKEIPVKSVRNLAPGDRVIAWQEEILDELKAGYIVHEIRKDGKIHFYEIRERRN